MQTLLLRAEAVLRGETQKNETPEKEAQASRHALVQWLLLIVLCGNLYGAAMGSFGGIFGDRILQIFYSAIKVPMLLIVTFGLSLPSFFIFNTLFGLRTDFGLALRALIESQAGLTVLLAALAPLTLVWNLGATDQQATVLFNAMLFGVAAFGGQTLLRRSYRPLIAQDARHATMLRIWGYVYAFVGIQMGWILRPFVGDPMKPVEFFRADTWGNAYEKLFLMIANQIRPLFGG